MNSTIKFSFSIPWIFLSELTGSQITQVEVESAFFPCLFPFLFKEMQISKVAPWQQVEGEEAEYLTSL